MLSERQSLQQMLNTLGLLYEKGSLLVEIDGEVVGELNSITTGVSEYDKDVVVEYNTGGRVETTELDIKSVTVQTTKSLYSNNTHDIQHILDLLLADVLYVLTLRESGVTNPRIIKVGLKELFGVTKLKCAVHKKVLGYLKAEEMKLTYFKARGRRLSGDVESIDGSNGVIALKVKRSSKEYALNVNTVRGIVQYKVIRSVRDNIDKEDKELDIVYSSRGYKDLQDIIGVLENLKDFQYLGIKTQDVEVVFEVQTEENTN